VHHNDPGSGCGVMALWLCIKGDVDSKEIDGGDSSFLHLTPSAQVSAPKTERFALVHIDDVNLGLGPYSDNTIDELKAVLIEHTYFHIRFMCQGRKARVFCGSDKITSPNQPVGFFYTTTQFHISQFYCDNSLS